MSNSDILLTVLADDEASEVFVIDCKFNVLARGIHCVELTVPPGIYRAKVRVGNMQSEKLFSVEPNEPGNHKLVQLDRIEFPSPIPLDRTSTTHEYHQQALYDMNAVQFPAANLGTGAALVIFLRDPSTLYCDLDAADLESYAQNFRGFVLSDWNGQNARALEDIGRLDVSHGYLILNTSVDPGAYSLSQPYGDGERLYLPLVIPVGWSLQVFVTMEPAGDNRLLRRANFDDAAMVLEKPNAVFSPQRPDLRVLEVARHALARGHNLIGDRAMAELLNSKFENPMMGILSANLILLDKNPNLGLAETVVTNTATLIGADYPDLLALSWKLSNSKYGRTNEGQARLDVAHLFERLKHPPLLQISWHFLMEAYRSAPDEAMFDDELRRLSSRLISSSVWLSWTSFPTPVPEPLPNDIGLDLSSEKSNTLQTSETICTEAQPDLSLIRDAAQYALSKAKELFAPATFSPDYFSFERAISTPEDVFMHVKAGEVLKGKAAGVKLTDELFLLLVKIIDWSAVVKFLKNQNLSHESPNMLSPLQRRLLLSLKAAREQLEEDGKVSEESLARWLAAADIPGQALMDNLKFLARFAKGIVDIVFHRNLPPN